MSLYKIDGHILSVNELYEWLGGFISLYRMGRIKPGGLPSEVRAALDTSHAEPPETTADAILLYLRDNEEYLGTIIEIVREQIPDIAGQTGGLPKKHRRNKS